MTKLRLAPDGAGSTAAGRAAGRWPARRRAHGAGRLAAAAVGTLLAAAAAAAAPHVTMGAGLVQEAGAQPAPDAMEISLRLRAESTSSLTGITIRVNDRDVTDVVLRNARVTLASDRRTGDLILDRLSVAAIDLAPAAERQTSEPIPPPVPTPPPLPPSLVSLALGPEYRIEATVRDEEGTATLAALLAPAPTRVPFMTLADGSYSILACPARAVLRDAASWRRFWGTEPPALDFASQTVLVVARGFRPTVDRVRITEVRRPYRAGGPLVIVVEETETFLTAISYPLHVITIPRWDGPVLFWVLGGPIGGPASRSGC